MTGEIDTESFKQFERLRELRVELAQLEQRFSENVLDATAAYEYTVTDEGRLNGIPEAANPDYDLFEDERLIQSVVDGRDRSLEDSLTLLLEQVDTWCGDRPLADDISLLALETLVPDASP